MSINTMIVGDFMKIVDLVKQTPAAPEACSER